MVSHPVGVVRRLCVGVLATVLLAACAGGVQEDGPAGTVPAGGTGEPSSDVPLIGPSSTEGFMPSWIRGLQIVRDGSEDAECAWHTSYPVVPGAEALNTALRDTVDTWMSTARQGTPQAVCPGGVGIEHVEIGFDFLVASTDVVGVRLTMINGNNAGNGISTDTFWYDGRTQRQSRAVSLLDSAATTTFSSRVRALLSGREGFDAEVAAQSLDPSHLPDSVRDVAFDTEGALHVRFASGIVAAVAAGDVEVTVPRTEATRVLSDFGRRVQEQAVHPTRRLTLPTPAPTSEPATSTPSVSPPGAAADAVDCRQVKCVALTFDDGPGPYTTQLLATLARYKARATFFVVGQNVVASPAIVRAEVAAGHEVGNHSWSHRDLTRLSRKDLTNQLAWDDKAIENATGTRPALIRPPYGAINATVRSTVDRPLILWNVDTLDWKSRNSADVAQAALGAVRPGSVVLMHDIHATTVQAVPTILDALARQRYHFVTISQLRAPTALQPGHVYSSGPTARTR